MSKFLAGVAAAAALAASAPLAHPLRAQQELEHVLETGYGRVMKARRGSV